MGGGCREARGGVRGSTAGSRNGLVANKRKGCIHKGFFVNSGGRETDPEADFDQANVQKRGLEAPTSHAVLQDTISIIGLVRVRFKFQRCTTWEGLGRFAPLLTQKFASSIIWSG